MKLLREIYDDERGTAMTEFVITIPIFVVIFIAISGLHKLQQGATQAHFEANRLMWEQAMEVMESHPSSEWGDLSNCNTECVLDHTEAHSAASAPGRTGLMGYVWGVTWYSDPVPIYDDEGKIIGYSQDYTTPTAAHGSILSRNPRLAPFVAVRSDANYVTSEFAWGAGSRYGQLEGTGTRDVSTSRFSTTFEFTYFATAPPRPLDEGSEAMWTVAVPRLTDAGEGILGLEHSMYEGFSGELVTR